MPDTALRHIAYKHIVARGFGHVDRCPFGVVRWWNANPKQRRGYSEQLQRLLWRPSRTCHISNEEVAGQRADAFVLLGEFDKRRSQARVSRHVSEAARDPAPPDRQHASESQRKPKLE